MIGKRLFDSSPRGIFALFFIAAVSFAAEPVSDGLTWFNRGTGEFNAGDVDGAAASFRRVIDLGSPLAPVAALFLAKCHRRGKRWREAAALLGSLDEKDENLEAGLADERRRLAEAARTEGTARLEAGAPGDALALYDFALRQARDEDAAYGRSVALGKLGRKAEAAEALLAYRREFPDGLYGAPRSRGPIWLQAELGAGYDSNVFLTAITGTPVSAAAARLGVDIGVRLVDNERGLFLRASYRGSWLEHVNQLSGRYVTHVVRGQLGWSDDEWLLRAAPSVSHQTVGAEPYLLQGAVALDAQRTWGDVAAGVQYEISRNYAQSSTYSYIDGYGHWGDVHVDWLGPVVQLRALYVLGYEDIQSLVSGTSKLPLANVAHGPGVKVLWSPEPWDTALSATYLLRSYPEASQPGGTLRNDGQLIVSARVARTISDDVSIFFSGSLLWNTSTLGSTSVSNRNYTQLLTLLGVSWNVLD